MGPEEVRIEGEDYNHIRNVLRMKEGDQIRVSNGKDRCVRTKITSFSEGAVCCAILSEEPDGTELPARIHLFQCLPKADKMETVIQKNVELGVAEIIPVASHRCVVKLDAKKAAAKTERWNSIAESAAKQCKRLRIPQVAPVMRFEEALRYAAGFERKAIPYENAEGMTATRRFAESIRPGEDVAVFIGPEGGFEEAEVEAAKAAGVLPLSLGRRILRTETAGMAFAAMLVYELESREEE